MSRFFSVFDFIFKHKCWLSVLVTVFIMTFLDSNNLIDRYKRNQRISDLQDKIAAYAERYEQNTKEYNQLMTDKRTVERVARESYYMTRPGEDLFIIQVGDEDPTQRLVQGDPVDEVKSQQND